VLRTSFVKQQFTIPHWKSLMKALVYVGTEDVVYRDEPEPAPPAEHELLLTVDACGLCGSDMHAYHGLDSRRVPPLVLGHEACGVVQNGPKQGERVIVNPLITCGECQDCVSGRSNLCASRELVGMRIAGAFAEQVVIPSRNALTMPADMGIVEASLTEPTAVAVHSVAVAERVMHRPVSEARALVLGAGAIGVLTALVLKSKGCTEVYLGDTNALRRETAEKHSFGHVYNPLQAEPDENSFDLVFDAVGSGKTRDASARMVRPGGVICHAGLQDQSDGLDTRRITLQEVSFIGNYCYTVADLQASIRLLNNGEFGALDWIEQRPLSAGASAFADVHNGTSAAPKIVLLP
jgi:threonine dehydrogenase-like Zn-dependent dehydrogenase